VEIQFTDVLTSTWTWSDRARKGKVQEEELGTARSSCGFPQDESTETDDGSGVHGEGFASGLEGFFGITINVSTLTTVVTQRGRIFKQTPAHVRQTSGSHSVGFSSVPGAQDAAVLPNPIYSLQLVLPFFYPAQTRALILHLANVLQPHTFL
jgi:hypothetical protein